MSFANDVRLADDMQQQHRYNAACAGARAASGKGAEAVRLEAKEQTRLRNEGCDWLQADLAAHTRLLEKNPDAAVKIIDDMQHWLRDADLASLRDEKELAKLPADERAALTKFWGEVKRLAK